MKKKYIIFLLGALVLGLCIAPTVSAITYKYEYAGIAYKDTIKSNSLTLDYHYKTNPTDKHKDIVKKYPKSYKQTLRFYKNGKKTYSKTIKNQKITNERYRYWNGYTKYTAKVVKKIKSQKLNNFGMWFKGKNYSSTIDKKGNVKILIKNGNVNYVKARSFSYLY
ncbi:hypothetical protein SDC9_21234 [bioreactor metagenome]|uniref:Uncharacterized protein n=1 Tax=bioreactor metagenome TaxID=1076179 RepID=A0A644U905_9ZZZZ|nr:hypothetical protein [Methanobrevibacter sp.]MEA4957975.1 hypothetical protein [Methanobrevibacter sp.]